MTEEMKAMMDELPSIWFNKFANRVIGMIDKEIDEETGTVANEYLAAMGSSSFNETEMHEINMREHKSYIAKLKELKRSVETSREIFSK